MYWIECQIPLKFERIKQIIVYIIASGFSAIPVIHTHLSTGTHRLTHIHTFISHAAARVSDFDGQFQRFNSKKPNTTAQIIQPKNGSSNDYIRATYSYDVCVLCMSH